DTAVFAAFGPAPAPEYAVAVVMEESGFGGTAAAPVARALFEALSGTTPLPPAAPNAAPVGGEQPLVEAGAAYDWRAMEGRGPVLCTRCRAPPSSRATQAP